MALFAPAYRSVMMVVPMTSGLGADFAPANVIIMASEGGYAKIAGDKGGETYAGIARNFYPNARVWTFIDMKKSRYKDGIIPTNTKFADLQFLVDEFYLERWNANRMGEIVSQPLANLLFDYQVHSGAIAIKAIQRLVGVPADGVMGPATLAAINRADASRLHDELKAERIRFLNSLADRDPSQEKFRAGWIARVSKFLDQNKTSFGLLGVVITVGTAYAIYRVISRNKKKTLKQAA